MKRLKESELSVIDSEAKEYIKLSLPYWTYSLAKPEQIRSIISELRKLRTDNVRMRAEIKYWKT